MDSEKYSQTIEYQTLAWEKIMQDSNLLLQLAHQKNWEHLLNLHEKRDALLHEFFNSTLAQDLIEKIQNDIEIIKTQDEMIVRLVKNNQSELSTEAKQLQLMKTRIKDYISADKNKL